MASSGTKPQTRRSVLAAALGGLVAAVGSVAGRPTRAGASTAAADPEAIHRNVNNPTSTRTSITCSSGTSVRAISSSGSNNSGLFAQATGTASRGVTGVAGTGVLGQGNGPAAHGVRGFVTGANAIGVVGFSESTSGSANPTGVLGRSKGSSGIGVLGQNLATVGDAFGVRGKTSSPQGTAIRAEHLPTSGDGAAVVAVTNSPNGTGVQAFGGTGVSALGDGPGNAGGTFDGVNGADALVVSGTAKFSTAGISTIASGTNSVVVTPGVDITATSKVLCTLMGNPGGTTTIQRLAKNSGAGTFQVFLTANASANCDVAWFVIS